MYLRTRKSININSLVNVNFIHDEELCLCHRFWCYQWSNDHQ